MVVFYAKEVRTLLFLTLIGAGVYFYAERFGLAVGFAPFTPVYLWNYTGEARYQIRATGIRAFIKVTVGGELQQGSFEVEVRRTGQTRPGLVKRFQGRFAEEIRYPADPNLYDVIFRFKDARGQIRKDWVSARDEF